MLTELKTSVEEALSREIAAGQMTEQEASELQKRLQYLAFEMTLAEKTAEVDKHLAALWLFQLQPHEQDLGRYQVDLASFQPLEARPEVTALAASLWSRAKQAGFLQVTEATVQFSEQGLQDYFCACYCQAQPFDTALLVQTAQTHFQDVWPLWAKLDSALLEKLFSFLKQMEDREVRLAAAIALGFTGDDRAIEPLTRILTDHSEDLEVRQGSAAALHYSGDSRAVDALARVLTNTAEVTSVRCLAAATLGSLSDSALSPLLASLTDTQSDVRSWVAAALGELGDLRAVDPLLTSLSDSNATVRQKSIQALAQIGDLEAVRPIIKTLSDPNSSVRLAAVRALSDLGDKQAIEPLVRALQDENADVRYMSATALGEIGDERVVPALTEMRENDKTRSSLGAPLKSAAYMALRRIQMRQDETA